MSYFIYFIGWIIFELALIHFYWAFGGRRGYSLAIPEKKDGQLIFTPEILECSIVGFGLLSILVFLIYKLGIIGLNLPPWITNYYLYIVGVLFMIRSIGDFKFVGLFKKIKHSKFASLDTKYFTPICVFIALSLFCIEYWK